MTITNPQIEYQYAGDGVTVAFAYPNVFFAPADLLVELSIAGVLVSPAPVLNGAGANGYTVTGTLDANTGEYLSGGTITLNTAPAAGTTVIISLKLAFTQNLALIDYAKNPSAPINAEFDRLTLLCLQLQAQIAAPASQFSPWYDPAVRALVVPSPSGPSGGAFFLSQGTNVGGLATLNSLNSRGFALFVPAHTASSLNLATAMQNAVAFKSLTALVHFNGTGNSGFRAGIAIGDASGKITQWALQQTGLARTNYTNINTFSASSSTGGLVNWNGPVWLRIAVSGSNLVYSFSLDGENFITELTEAANTFLGTITLQGIALDNASANADEGAFLNCYSFAAT